MHFVKCVLCTNLAENVYWKFVCIYELHSDHVQCDWSGDLTILEDWLQKMGIFWCFFIRKEVIILQTRTRISTLSFDKIVPVWRKYYAWQKNARALISTFFLHLYGERERLVKTLEESRKGIVHKWCPTIFTIPYPLTSDFLGSFQAPHPPPPKIGHH